MTISQEFKDKIKAGKFREALILALSESVELTVTTSIVNDVNQTESDTFISTEVNLVEGEITNSISKDILANPELCQLHFEQVKQGQEIIFNNLKSFQAMLVFLEEVSESKSPELSENTPKSLPFEDKSNHDSD